MQNHVGVAGLGIYIPDKWMTAKEISEATQGVWAEQAVIDKLGVIKKTIPGEGDGAQAMGTYASQKALEDAGMDATEIDVVICITEEWKEYPLVTSANVIINGIGATNAWGVDVQNRCCTCVTALKMAKDILMADDSVNVALVAGGYRNSDLVDYTDSETSIMFDIGAGGGAIILKKNLGKNALLGSHIIADGSLAYSAGVEVGGTVNPVTAENLDQQFIIRIMEPATMKKRLGEVSMKNWMTCIETALEKSGETEVDYLAILHFKRSAHEAFVAGMKLRPEQSIYLEEYGHIGQIDQILSLYLAREQGKIKDGDNAVMLAAGIGYTWAANVIKWGPVL
ncbi:MAG: 3-oxoacyl-ACP synthase [Oscillospiraceae bacterium]|nr:3-oxoacyl-ACP synthase [Oscillospiraceae bacterium]